MSIIVVRINTSFVPFGNIGLDPLRLTTQVNVQNGRIHIRDEVQRYFPGTADMLPISPTAHDIGLYIRMRLGRDSELDARDKELEADILRIIPVVTSGSYVLF